MDSYSLSYHQPEVLRLQLERVMISEGSCNCGNESMGMSPNKDTLSLGMAANSTQVNKLVFASSPMEVKVARCQFCKFVV